MFLIQDTAWEFGGSQFEVLRAKVMSQMSKTVSLVEPPRLHPNQRLGPLVTPESFVDSFPPYEQD